MPEMETLIVRTFAVLGILGSATIMISDWLGWTRPMSAMGERVALDGIKAPLKSAFGGGGIGISDKRRYIASIVGGLAMFPCALGFATVFVGLAPANLFFAAIVAILLTGTMFYGVIAHAMMGFINELTQVRTNWDKQAYGYEEISHLVERAIKYWAPFAFALLLVCWLVGSIGFSVMVLTQDTAFPWWMGFANLFLLSEAARFANNYLPNSVSRWVGPAHMHICSTLPFFLLTTYFVW